MLIDVLVFNIWNWFVTYYPRRFCKFGLAFFWINASAIEIISLNVSLSNDFSEYVHTKCNAVSAVSFAIKLTSQSFSSRNWAANPSPRFIASISNVQPWNPYHKITHKIYIYRHANLTFYRILDLKLNNFFLNCNKFKIICDQLHRHYMHSHRPFHFEPTFEQLNCYDSSMQCQAATGPVVINCSLPRRAVKKKIWWKFLIK